MVKMMFSFLALRKKKSMQIATFFTYYCCYLHREEGYDIGFLKGLEEKEAFKKQILINKEHILISRKIKDIIGNIKIYQIKVKIHPQFKNPSVFKFKV